MDRFERIYRLHRILTNRHTPISRTDLEQELECSRSTVKRAIEDSRDYLQLPVKYSRQFNGYILEAGGDKFELPGIWFNSSEIFALLTTHKLLAEIQPGVLESHIAPLRSRLEAILKNKYASSKEILNRIRVLQMSPRPTDVDEFQRVTDALITRRKLKILYHGRRRDATTERWVSPQRLIYYRDNWYLDGWCHLRKALRSFSLDRIHVSKKGDKAYDVDDVTLDTHFSNAYGIFSGQASNEAVIRFSSSIARWVADEHWHSDQKERVLPDGGWEITVPYSDPTELVMDILKYGPDAEVIEPASLRRLVRRKLHNSLEKYKK